MFSFHLCPTYLNISGKKRVIHHLTLFCILPGYHEPLGKSHQGKGALQMGF